MTQEREIKLSRIAVAMIGNAIESDGARMVDLCMIDEYRGYAIAIKDHLAYKYNISVCQDSYTVSFGGQMK